MHSQKKKSIFSCKSKDMVQICIVWQSKKCHLLHYKNKESITNPCLESRILQRKCKEEILGFKREDFYLHTHSTNCFGINTEHPALSSTEIISSGFYYISCRMREKISFILYSCADTDTPKDTNHFRNDSFLSVN